MELLDRLEVRQGAETRSIELYRGDLADLKPDEAVDILVVSAFPDDYSPTPSSLIGALWVRGVSVASLARSKAVDLRQTSSCWLSSPLHSKPPGIAFDRILCFEPRVRGNPPEVVGDIFRCLVPFLGPQAMGTTVAMPLVACGDQGTPIDAMLRPLLEAAFNWMSHGLQLSRLKIVVYSPGEAAKAAAVFATLKTSYASPAAVAAPGPAPLRGLRQLCAQGLGRGLGPHRRAERRGKDVRVFLDRTAIDAGAAWQREIYAALEKCRRVIAVFSPAYLESKRCQEEYNIAHCRQIDSGAAILFPIFLYSASLPYYMKMVQHVDCREGDVERLRSCCGTFLSAIAADPT